MQIQHASKIALLGLWLFYNLLCSFNPSSHEYILVPDHASFNITFIVPILIYAPWRPKKDLFKHALHKLSDRPDMEHACSLNPAL